MQNWSPSLENETGPNRFPRARLRNIRWIKPEETIDPADVHPLRAPSRLRFKGVASSPSRVLVQFAEKLVSRVTTGDFGVYKNPDTIYAFATDKALNALSGLSYGDHFSVFVVTQQGDNAVLDFDLATSDFHAALGVGDRATQSFSFSGGRHDPRLVLSDKASQHDYLAGTSNRPLLYLADKAAEIAALAEGASRVTLVASDRVRLGEGLSSGLNLRVVVIQSADDKARQDTSTADSEYFENYILVVLGDKASELAGVGLQQFVLHEAAEKAVNRVLTGSGLFAATILPFVQNWADQVEANGGTRPSGKTQLALSNFYQGLIDNGLLAKIKVLNAFVPDNLIAARSPFIVGPGSVLWANSNFVDADLGTTGLKGNGTNKCLNAGFKMDQVWSGSDAGCFLYVSEDVSEAGITTGAVDVAGNPLSGYWRFSAHQGPPDNGMLVAMFDADTNAGMSGRWTSANFATTVLASVEIIGTNLKTYHESGAETFALAGTRNSVNGAVPTKADCFVFCSNEGDITI